MIVSRFVVDNVVRKTLRLDYDGHSLRGGWSPAFLSWDDGVRAADADDVDSCSSLRDVGLGQANYFRRNEQVPDLRVTRRRRDADAPADTSLRKAAALLDAES